MLMKNEPESGGGGGAAAKTSSTHCHSPSSAKRRSGSSSSVLHQSPHRGSGATSSSSSSLSLLSPPSKFAGWSFLRKFTIFLFTPWLLAVWKLSTVDFDAYRSDIASSSYHEHLSFLPPKDSIITTARQEPEQNATIKNNVESAQQQPAVNTTTTNTARQPNTTPVNDVTAWSAKTTQHDATQDTLDTVLDTKAATMSDTAVSSGRVAWDAAFYRRWKLKETAPEQSVNDNEDDDDKGYSSYSQRIAGTATAVIAYATTITSCKANNKGYTYMDMAAVLAHSIHLSSIRNPNSTSTFDYQLYAFIHPDAIEASNISGSSSSGTFCADQMQALGYIVQIRDTPINVSIIQRQSYIDRLTNPNSGCCGAKEFLKFYSYTLTNHPIVVHVDLDVMILQPLDDFFHAMLLPDTVDRFIPHAMWPDDRRLMGTTNEGNHHDGRQRVISAMFTRDYPMLSIKDGNTQKRVKVGVQGGFLMVRPNITIFNELCQLILQGHFETGWYEADPDQPDKKKVHYPGFYGAAQVQGLLAFYYGHVNPNQTVELNRCVVNNMVDNPRHEKGMCITGQTDDECQDCRLFNISDLYTAHFTFCAKPSLCYLGMSSSQALCYALHSEWHRIRYDLETVLYPQDSNSNKTTQISELEPKLRDMYGHCTKGGGYFSMDWQNLASLLKNLTMVG